IEAYRNTRVVRDVIFINKVREIIHLQRYMRDMARDLGPKNVTEGLCSDPQSLVDIRIAKKCFCVRTHLFLGSLIIGFERVGLLCLALCRQNDQLLLPQEQAVSHHLH
ncbi:Uncharacterized protein FKW44_007984, partial [Caligus rogercresseyi]